MSGLPVAPAGYAQTYFHNFNTQGQGDWEPWNIVGSPILSDSPAAGLGITVTGPNQGAIYTSDNALVPPGSFIQAQMYLPGTSAGQIGNWPAFWAIAMEGQVTTRQNGEIDLVEGLGGGASFHVHSAANVDGVGGSFRGQFIGWHTFSALWSDDEVIFWYDDIQMDVIPLVSSNTLTLKYMNQSIGVPTEWFGGPALYPATTHLSHVGVWSKS